MCFYAVQYVLIDEPRRECLLDVKGSEVMCEKGLKSGISESWGLNSGSRIF